MKKAFIVRTDHIYAMQENGTGIDSVWMNEGKAEKRMEELNREWKDEIYFVDAYSVSK